MKKILIVILILFSVVFSFAQPVKIMIITGGQEFDTKSFFAIFDSFQDIVYKHYQQPEANQELSRHLGEDFDVLVFYDNWQNISETEKIAYLHMAENGKPFLFIHHSIRSYQKWPEFEKLIGGKFVEEARNVPEEEVSKNEKDVWVYANVENYTPVTVGMNQVRFFDEVYDNVRISDDIIPLLKTRHPQSIDIIAWQHKYKASDVVYIQPGYDYRTYQSEDFRKLVKQAILFLAKKSR
jgi:type 1 glutamine amidotransferase